MLRKTHEKFSNRDFSYKIFLAIPIINAIADNTTNYFKTTINPGNLRAAILLLFAVYFIFKKFPKGSINALILYYLAFMASLCLISSSPIYSLSLYIKFFLSTISFCMGYYYINDIVRFKQLNYSYSITLILVLIIIVISDYYKLGGSAYLADSFYFGTGRVNITKNLAILIIISPISLIFIKKKIIFWIFTAATTFSTAIVIVGVKRTAVASIIFATINLIVFLKQKKLTMKYVLIIGIILSLFSPFYTKLIIKRYKARIDRIEIYKEKNLVKESRFSEIKIVLKKLTSTSFSHLIFGSELFNDRSFFNVKRMLHMDYSILINGSGLIGAVLYMWIIFKIIKFNFLFKLSQKSEFEIILLNIIFWNLIVALLILSIASTVYAIGLRSLIFQYLGGIIGLKYSIYRSGYKNISMNEIVVTDSN